MDDAWLMLIVNLCVFAGLAVLCFHWRNVAAAREEEWLCEQIDLLTRRLTAAEVLERRRASERAMQAALEAHVDEERYRVFAQVQEVGSRVVVRARASDRARQWLMKHLSPEQVADFSCTGCFNVRGGDTGKLYRITYGCSMNIIVLSADGMVTGQRICFSPKGNLNTFDVMLAQKVSLESNELATVRIAGRNLGPPVQRTEW